jgi:hypothetical protein
MTISFDQDHVGRVAWSVMDLMAIVVATNYAGNDKAVRDLSFQFFSLMQRAYPCGVCREGLSRILRGVPPELMDEPTAATFPSLIYTVHDFVNRDLVARQIAALQRFVSAKAPSNQKEFTRLLMDAVQSKLVFTWQSISYEAFSAKLEYIKADPRGAVSSAWEFCSILLQSDSGDVEAARTLVTLILERIVGVQTGGKRLTKPEDLRKIRAIAQESAIRAHVADSNAELDPLVFMEAFISGLIPEA